MTYEEQIKKLQQLGFYLSPNTTFWPNCWLHPRDKPSTHHYDIMCYHPDSRLWSHLINTKLGEKTSTTKGSFEDALASIAGARLQSSIVESK